MSPRFARVVERDYNTNHVNPEAYDRSWVIATTKLLQRQHAAVVRKVKAMPRTFCTTAKGRRMEAISLRDLLGWLNERGR